MNEEELKSLLKRYVKHVESIEGIDFLNEGSEYLTEEEIQYIRELTQE